MNDFPLLVEPFPRTNLYREPEPFRSYDREQASHPCLQEPDVQRSGDNRKRAQRTLQHVTKKATSNNGH